MIRVKGAQGSPAWVTARCGIPTASRFEKILTPKNLTVSKSAREYIHELLAEWAVGEPLDSESSLFMERGIEEEGNARRAYEFTNDATVEQVGLCLTSPDGAGWVGCSPDGLIGDDGGLEIKTPKLNTHIQYMLNPQALVSKYRLQVHGSLWVCDRQWWDIMSYNPVLPDVVVRVERDDEIFTKIKEGVHDFAAELCRLHEEMRGMGVEPDPRPLEARKQFVKEELCPA